MAYTIAVVRLTVFEAWRSRLLWVTIVAVGTAFGAAQFLAGVAIIEGDQIQLAIIAALLRAASVFMVMTFVISSTVREFGDKVSEILLSQPVPRWEYLTSKFAGFTVIALILACVVTCPLMVLGQTRGAMLWGASLACELTIMTAVSLFCVISLPQVLPSLAAAGGVYLLGRSVETIRNIASSPLNGGGGWLDSVMRSSVDFIAVAVPSLDRFSLTRWLYETPPSARDLSEIAVQTIVYVSLIGAATLFDLYRRNY